MDAIDPVSMLVQNWNWLDGQAAQALEEMKTAKGNTRSQLLTRLHEIEGRLGVLRRDADRLYTAYH
jgi:hypothetical protein